LPPASGAVFTNIAELSHGHHKPPHHLDLPLGPLSVHLVKILKNLGAGDIT
jgi:hypothetical protein